MTIRMLVSFLATFLVTGCTTHHLVKYNNFPCQNKFFELSEDQVQVVNGVSMMRKGYYYITRNSLENPMRFNDSHYPESQIIKKTYQTGDKFKVIGYYKAYDTYSIPLPAGGGPTPNYLIQS